VSNHVGRCWEGKKIPYLFSFELDGLRGEREDTTPEGEKDVPDRMIRRKGKRNFLLYLQFSVPFVVLTMQHFLCV
jgi:hypothetical protein